MMEILPWIIFKY